MSRIRSLSSAAGIAAHGLQAALRRALGVVGALGAAGIVGVLAFLAPRAALACAVCSAGRDDESNTAFLISTIFLSLLPLAGLGTLVFVIWRRLRALEAQGRGAESAPIASASVASSIPAP